MIFALLALVLLFGSASAQGACASPGRDGSANISGTVNTYYRINATNATYSAGTTPTIPLTGKRGNLTPSLVPGDLVLIIQMQCADIDSSDSLNYGDGPGGNNDQIVGGSGYTTSAPGECQAGRYEFVRAGPGSTDSQLVVASPLQYSYAHRPNQNLRRTMQVIRVPQYLDATLTGTVTAAPWDGFTGGVVVLDVAGRLNLNGQSVNVDGLGFRGGGARARASDDPRERFAWATDNRHGTKGEGIAGTPRFVSEKRDLGSGGTTVTDLGSTWAGYPGGDFARGAPGNAGGGGTYWNSTSDNGGGGGGGNGGPGGRGGAGWRAAGYTGINPDYGNLTEKKWGFGGSRFAEASIARLVMGGGGGAGDNNNNSDPGLSSGGAGGGIILLRAGRLTGAGTLSARGARAPDNPLNDGAGGGGAGGSVLVFAGSHDSLSLTINAQGGRGGNAWWSTASGVVPHGPGGGGGGGVVVRNVPATVDVSGGLPGATRNNTSGVDQNPRDAGTHPEHPSTTTIGPHGARAGSLGQNISFASYTDDSPGQNAGYRCATPTLALAKASTDVNGSPLQLGDILEYTLTVNNTGSGYGVNVQLQDPIPPGTTFVSGSLQLVSGLAPSSLTYNSTANRVEASWASFPPGQSAIIRFRVQVGAGPAVTNTATVTYTDLLNRSYPPSQGTVTDSVLVSYTISGQVYHDRQPNGAKDAEDWSDGATVYVKLVQGTTVLAVQTVSAGSGAYSFSGVAPGSYTLVLDNNASTADTTPTPPSGWLFINPAGGSRSVTVSSTNVLSQDFGLFHGFRVEGRVFYDDGEGGGNANNALQDGGERGVGSVSLTAGDGSSTRTATTDGSGFYRLYIPASFGSVTLSHPIRPATGRNDGSVASQVASWADATSLTSSGAVVSLGSAATLAGATYVRNFGVVRPSLLSPDQSGQATSPGVITYAHQFRPGTLGNVTLSLAPTQFGYQVRRDVNCDGDFDDAGEGFQGLPLSFSVDATWPRQPDGSLRGCGLEVQVIVPAGVSAGQVDLAPFALSLTWASNPAVVESRSLTDTTTVIRGGELRLTKQARNHTKNTPFASSAQGRPGEVLEYRIEYQNIGSQPIFNVILFDPVPFFTTLVQNAYGGSGEVELVCPNGTVVRPDLGPVSNLSLNLAALCTLSTAPLPGGGSAPALLPGQGGFFVYRVQVN